MDGWMGRLRSLFSACSGVRVRRVSGGGGGDEEGAMVSGGRAAVRWNGGGRCVWECGALRVVFVRDGAG